MRPSPPRTTLFPYTTLFRSVPRERADRRVPRDPPRDDTSVVRRVLLPVVLRSVRHRSEEHTSELQSHSDLVCRLLLEKKKHIANVHHHLMTAPAVRVPKLH